MIRREHYPIDAAEFEEQIKEGRRKIEARERIVHVVAQIIVLDSLPKSQREQGFDG